MIIDLMFYMSDISLILQVQELGKVQLSELSHVLLRKS